MLTEYPYRKSIGAREGGEGGGGRDLHKNRKRGGMSLLERQNW